MQGDLDPTCPNEKIFYFTTENFTLLLFYIYYRKLYFTTANFNTRKVFFSTKFEPIKIPCSVRKLKTFFILILIDELEFE